MGQLQYMPFTCSSTDSMASTLLGSAFEYAYGVYMPTVPECTVMKTWGGHSATACTSARVSGSDMARGPENVSALMPMAAEAGTGVRRAAAAAQRARGTDAGTGSGRASCG